MNILHFTPDFNYGDGRSYYVFLLLKYLKKSGNSVYLFTNGGDSFDRFKDMGITVFIENSFSNKSKFLNSVNLLNKFVTENKIDVIHSHHRYFELIANACRKINKRNVKTVFTSLSLVDKRYFVEFSSEAIIAVSKCIEDMLINKFKIDPRKITLIPNFTDSEEIKKADITKKDHASLDTGKRINILCIGRYHKDKSQKTLLEALKILNNQKIHLTLIGEGPEINNYKKFIIENRLNARIEKPKNDLHMYFNQTDICILTSVKDPFPGFMLQSGLFGKPFIGTDTDGIAELITDKKNGLLFKKGDASDLAGAIRVFISDNKLRETCGQELHKIVMKKYTEKTVIPEIEKVYRNLLSAGNTK